ncbi:MAG TPA: heavy metal sensor histidine kinase [Bryobacteraceae bacterium]|nr:heavy metal sensor histidine kinase [Bryobacteraceae bacterium]
MIRSLRFRITVWYLALFSLLFVLSGVFLHGVLARALMNRLDESLSEEASTTAALFQDEFEEMKGDVPLASSEAVSGMRLRGSSVAVLAGGKLLAASAPIPQPELEAIAARAQAGGQQDQVVAVPQAGPNGARAALQHTTVGGRPYLVLAVQPLDEIAAALAALRRVLFLALPLVIGLAGLGGYWLASRSLAPLGWMAEQARRITHSNLDTRLEIGKAADELAMLSESFNELLSRLDQSFDSIKRFVADASHELRTPISIIRGEADVALSHDRGAGEYRETLATILDESRRLSRLVDDLLNLARADAGRVKLQVQEFYLNDLLAECCRSAQTLAHARDICLECLANGDVPFRGDEELLRRMVMNLLDNAIRYTPDGGKVAAALEADSTGLRIRVSDTGVGIAAESAAHVFERFFRADKARSRQDGGFGLGLAIVKWVAEAHRGAVELVSTPGAGSTFTVTLPAK